MKKKKNKKIILWIFVAAIMTTIFFFSNQGAVKSENSSSKVAEYVTPIVNSDYEQMSELDKYYYKNFIDHTLRKSAHYFIYFALGFFTLLTVSRYSIKLWKKYAISGVICILFAFSDEVHQYFVPGRTCSISDVLIDALGSITGFLVLTLIFIIIKRKKTV